jgi:hypothetical protein
MHYYCFYRRVMCFCQLTLIVLGEAKVKLADFDVKLHGKLIMYIIIKKITIPAETSCKSFFYFIHHV